MKFIKIILTFILFIPAVILSCLWQAFYIGWVYGEWLFDPELFENQYSKKVHINESFDNSF